MSVLAPQFVRGGVHLPKLGLWLDPHEPQKGPERVFVSHAHSDHLAAHREVILSAPTAQLMRCRLRGERREIILPFGQTRAFSDGPCPHRLTLLPAGHIFGSAMALVEAEGQSLLYTGDFKLRRGRSAEPCEPRRADLLVMETTYGRPEYRFPPTDAVLQSIIRFCREALDNDETPILLGYSLGKSQELLCGLAEAGLPLMLHTSVLNLTKIYEQFGHCFPKYEPWDAAAITGKVLLCPPGAAGSAGLRHAGPVRTAVLTGWSVHPSMRFRYGVDAAFPLSDHADFPDLVALVRQVAPQRVYTVHGFAAEFAQTLRDLGFDAQALSEPEQLGLNLKFANPESRFANEPAVQTSKACIPETSLDSQPSTLNFFRGFAEACGRIAGAASKLEKTRLLAEYLHALPEDQLVAVAVWFTGLSFAAGGHKPLQLGWALLRDALSAVAGLDAARFHQVYLKHSDLGETAHELFQGRPAPISRLTLADVQALFKELHAARGPTAKRPRLVQALDRCDALEAKCLVKIMTSGLRIGLKEGLVEEAIAQAFAATPDQVRQANLLLGQLGETALLARRGQLAGLSLVPFRPLKCMLATPAATAAEVCQRMRQRAQAAQPFWVEDNYDGIRCQLHKVGPRVALYAPDLNDVTRTFSEVAGAARSLPGDLILDGQIVAMRGETVLPVSALQKRLGRREDDLFPHEEIPIQFVAFDLLWLNGRALLDQPLSDRRAALESLPALPACFHLATITTAATPEEVEAAFAAARRRGNEGILIKDPASAYTPGRRGLAWLKLPIQLSADKTAAGRRPRARP